MYTHMYTNVNIQNIHINIRTYTRSICMYSPMNPYVAHTRVLQTHLHHMCAKWVEVMHKHIKTNPPTKKDLKNGFGHKKHVLVKATLEHHRTH